jgi:hypothetical protein
MPAVQAESKMDPQIVADLQALLAALGRAGGHFGFGQSFGMGAAHIIIIRRPRTSPGDR